MMKVIGIIHNEVADTLDAKIHKADDDIIIHIKKASSNTEYDSLIVVIDQQL